MNIVDSSFVFDYSRALYYVCDYVNVSGSLLERVPAKHFEENVTKEVALPPGATCTVFGCYVDSEFAIHRLFINGSCTTGKRHAWMDAQSTQCSCSIPDIDECELEPCHEQAICTNTDGSYTCACNLGSTGGGIVCEGTCTFCSPAPNLY